MVLEVLVARESIWMKSSAESTRKNADGNVDKEEYTEYSKAGDRAALRWHGCENADGKVSKDEMKAGAGASQYDARPSSGSPGQPQFPPSWWRGTSWW